ncbi:aldehyde dehydrogenase family protein [Micromonospora sp. 15K316]|uniref:aldehyde dehydrogenase family protein n=1 Tax=Micromonospora sp. 15K316 TaxID=2530376 RepID=UPI001A9E1BDF|nr:aldehyde dehydrogenase family protein [Micromonospora sp. 15K316]
MPARPSGRGTATAHGRTTDHPGSPVTGGAHLTVPAADADLRAAVDAAQAAFPGWASTAATKRRTVLLDAADLLEQRTEALAGILRQETAGSLAWAGFTIRLAAGQLRQGAAMATRPVAELLADIPYRAGATECEQAGVVVSFVPWNGSMVFCARAIALTLAVGNTVLIRPRADAPVISALILADVLAEAGLPAGVVNVVTGDHADAPAAVEALIADPRVRRVTLTGPIGAGRVVGRLPARRPGR